MKKFIAIIVFIAIAVFGIGAFFYSQNSILTGPPLSKEEAANLTRPYSPVIGPLDAPVTIVEFFDPSCEACKMVYPFVKEVLAKYPTEVRLVLRYAPFHTGSDEAVKILETARLQNKFEQVLESLFQGQSEWAAHSGPNLNKAWEIAQSAGLDLDKAKADSAKAEIMDLLKTEMDDVKTYNVQATPTFFVNGKRIVPLGPQHFESLVDDEVKKTQKP